MSPIAHAPCRDAGGTSVPAIRERVARAADGYATDMTDWTEQGAVPVEDAVVDDPPTVDEVLERQRRDYPEQAASQAHAPRAMARPGAMREGAEEGEDEVEALIDAGGTPVGDAADPAVEGPNPA